MALPATGRNPGRPGGSGRPRPHPGRRVGSVAPVDDVRPGAATRKRAPWPASVRHGSEVSAVARSRTVRSRAVRSRGRSMMTVVREQAGDQDAGTGSGRGSDPGRWARRMTIEPWGIQVGPVAHLAEERDRLAALTSEHFDIRPLGATIGAEIEGIDLCGPLDDAVVAELRRCLHGYKVLFFRDQPLTPGAARRLRPPLRRPRGPPLHPGQSRPAGTGPLRKGGHRRRLRERLALRCVVAGRPVTRRRAACRGGPAGGGRHALRGHVRRLRRPRPRAPGTDRRA